jgi:hypothetical protein
MPGFTTSGNSLTSYLLVIGNKRIPPTNIPSRLTFWSRTGEAGKPQPDNFEGLKAGKLKDVKDDSGLTIEGLQEFYDEACLAGLLQGRRPPLLLTLLRP